ncbi:DUF3578 domain-containing protein [uncultured Litoreibacter sp.]|uniref:MrcB family domain-containing protein n=1 Tax=uncultured Litoreibacter sp. TaxID=1392394 RepID=UPI00263A24FE|nr:DUF3578 domain-containing protein [uncultured Litoreibacter sp.]
MLHQMLARLAREYAHARVKPFAESEFGNFVRHDIAIEAKKQLIFLPFALNVKASVGAGVWASVPWLGFFDPLITKSATTGFYVVYLINPHTQDIFLSLNQGTTQVYQEFGESKGREVLKRRAQDMALRVPEFSKHFNTSEINLGSTASLPTGYVAGHSFGRKYNAASIDEGSFYEDLQQMIYAYETLIDRGGSTPSDVMQEEAGSKDIEETRRYILSRRIERSESVRKEVLKALPPICQGCNLDPAIHYNYSGKLQNTPLDVHHSKPISGLSEGETRRYQVPDDFMVLCPTCHRMIHKQNNTADLQALKETLQFLHK